MVKPGRILVAFAALPAGVGAAMLALASEREASPLAAAILALVVGWSYVGSGLVAWHQRPENRLGPVMVFVGFAWFAAFLADANHALPFTAGMVIEIAYLAGFVYLMLSFPSGRLVTRLERVLFGSAVVLALPVQIAWLVLAEPAPVFSCEACPENLLQLSRRDSVAEGILNGQRVLGVIFSLVTAALLLQRWLRASAPQRRAVAPVLWAGSGLFAALAFSATNDVVGEPLGPAPAWVLSFVFATVPIAVLAVLLRRRLARGAVAELAVELGGIARRADLRSALARALGDPSLELAFWVPRRQRYVDRNGLPFDLPAPASGRAATVVEREGKPIAALIHDSAVSEDADLVESVCAVAGLALENERLQAELRARLGELRESRARIVEAAAAERRRIERNLHDGTQQRLVSIAMALGLADAKLENEPAAAREIVRRARMELSGALEELRELSHGIHPGILSERGLGPALEELAYRAPVPVELAVRLDGRLPEAVEAAAYYVVSESLANVAKHAGASVVTVRVERENGFAVIEIADDGRGGAAEDGSGLRGLADRIEALGGRFAVASPPGEGTLVRAEVPCG